MTKSVDYITANVFARADVTEDLRCLWLDLGDRGFNFKPGQYCTLLLDGIERAYSIVSAPHEAFLEIFVELVPEGELTPKIWELNVGDPIYVRPTAKGIFTMDTRAHHHFMLATVTGIAPFMSMIRSYLHEGRRGHKFYVLLGASYRDELTYDGELTGLAALHPDCIKFVPTISRPEETRNSGWRGEKGRVNVIAEKYLTEFLLPKDDTMVYACGHPDMIADVRSHLLPDGWKLKEERFWKG